MGISMDRQFEIEYIQKEFSTLCSRYDQLRHESIQGNQSTRIAYQECEPILEIKQRDTKDYVSKLAKNEPKLNEYYLQNSKKALKEFEEALRNAELKINNARSIPPFLY